MRPAIERGLAPCGELQHLVSLSQGSTQQAAPDRTQTDRRTGVPVQLQGSQSHFCPPGLDPRAWSRPLVLGPAGRLWYDLGHSGSA